MKTNKALLQELAAWFLTQDKETVCRLAAGFMLDLHRCNLGDLLSEKDAGALFVRLVHNSEQLRKFAENGPNCDLEVITVTSDNINDLIQFR